VSPGAAGLVAPRRPSHDEGAGHPGEADLRLWWDVEEPEAPPDEGVPRSAALSDPGSRQQARHQPGPTLDALVSAAWDGLASAASAPCPVCGTQMDPRWSAGAGVVGGRCGGCGAELA
jgi:hypothetical protein